MIILFLSDTHIRSTVPVGRVDNFLETQWNKWNQIQSICVTKKVELVLQAGDLFDRPVQPFDFLIKYADLFSRFPCDIMAIPGQHDKFMRSDDLTKTAFGLYEYFGLIKVLSDGQALLSKDGLKILLVHDMIGTTPLYPGHQYTRAQDYLMNHPQFDIILCGDYHYPFFIQTKDKKRTILNTGCLLRMTRDEKMLTHRPHVWLYNTVTDYWELIYLRIESAEKVFLSAVESTIIQQDMHQLYAFIEKLKKQGNLGLDYLSVLDEYYKEHETSTEIKEIINEVLTGVACP